MTKYVSMERVRKHDDGAYRRSLPKPSDNRQNINDAALRDTSSCDNQPEWHALDFPDHPDNAYAPEDFEKSGYAVAGSKDGRIVLFTFGCCLLGSELTEE